MTSKQDYEITKGGGSLSVKKGEFLSIVGPSRCGKSTFLDLVGGLSKPSEGQKYALFPWRTALGNVEFGIENKKITKDERREIARKYFSLVGLAGFEEGYPYELSGGMKKRVAIAIAFAFDPDMLLMYEPFGALDSQTREILQPARPGVIKKIMDISPPRAAGVEDDIRTSNEFVRSRHELWGLLKEEVVKAQQICGNRAPAK